MEVSTSPGSSRRTGGQGDSLEDAYLFLSRGEYLRSGEGFFPSLARYLAQSLEMDYVCIDRLEEGRRARTVAVYFDGAFEDNVEYHLDDTPCGQVAGQVICCFPAGVRHLFPKDAVLQDMKAECYLGTTLWGYDGNPIGLIAVIGRKPLADPSFADSLLRLVSVRAAGELERLFAEERLAWERQLLEETGRMAKVGGWEIDLQSGALTWTEEVYRIHGLDPSIEPAVDEAVDFYKPGSREQIVEAVEKARNGGQGFDLTLEFKSADGRDLWVHAIGKPDPKAGKVRGTFQDITEWKRAELRVVSLLEERNLLLKEVHHRVKNNMANVYSLLSLQALLAESEETKRALGQAASRVRTMQAVYEELLDSTDFRSLSAKSHLEGILATLQNMNDAKDRIELSSDMDEAPMDVNVLFRLGLILNELVTNAFKYAFPGEARGSIHVSFKRDGSSEWLLVVKDDGIGISAGGGGRKHSGLGLSLVESLAAQLKGSFSVVSEGGMRAELRFKLA